MPPAPEIFNRRTVQLNRDRAARGRAGVALDDFLYDDIAERLVDRLQDLRRDFPRVLILDARGGALRTLLGQRWGKELVVTTDIGAQFAQQQARQGPTVQCDCEALPFRDCAFDLIIAGGGLHWVNDLPGTFAQIQRCLVPDGLFLGAMIGGQSLAALNTALMSAEMMLSDGASPRISPGLELVDAAALLQRAGFALPVADVERVTVSHSHPLKLVQDLRQMGEGNALVQRNRATPPRALFPLAFGEMMQTEQRLETTFELLFLAGWRPDVQKQQQPLRPGAGQTSLTEVFKPEA